jgi:predicted secreted protein
MGIFEAIVVFVGAWWLFFLPVLSAGTRSQHEAGTVLPGTERGAPEGIRWRWKFIIPSAGAALVTFLLWLALHMHWLDFMIPRR